MNSENKNIKLISLTSKSGSSSVISNRFIFLLMVFTLMLKLYLFHNQVFGLEPYIWQNQGLTVDYSYGFIRRGLLGTFVTIIRNCFNTDYYSAIKAVQYTGFILFAVSFLLFFRILLKNEHGKTYWFTALVFIALDCFGFQLSHFGLFDTFNIGITLLMVYLIIKDKSLFLIPVLAGICVLIHEAYPMMFFAIIVAMLIYRFGYAGNRKSKIRYAVVFILTGITVSILFVYFYFIHPGIETSDVNTVLNASREKLGGDFETSGLRQIWFDPEITRYGQMWINGKPTEDFFILIKIVIMNVIVCSPLIFMTARFWIRIIKNEQVMYRKILLFFCSISVFLVLPLILIHNDQGRWFYDIIFFEIITVSSIALLNFNQEKDVLSGLTKLSVVKLILILFYGAFYFAISGYELNFISVHLVELYNLIFNS